MQPKMNDEERGYRHSLWQLTATEDLQYPALRANREAEVVIVGGGFTGLSAALHLSELGKSVLLLEAREIAWGASGRNGGQVNPGWKLMPSEIEARYERARGARIFNLIDGACDLVFDLIDRHQIECAPRRAPYFRAAYRARGIKEVEQWVREWEARGAPVSFKSEQETHQLVGSTFFHGGMEDARGGSLQPLSYCRGLARAAVKAGAELFTNSHVGRIDRVKSDWLVTTDHGAHVSAQYLIIATNGYTDSLWPGLKKQIVPVASLQAATRPLSKDVWSTILPQGHHFSDSRRVMVYCRVDETNRFQIGGRGSPLSPSRQQANTRHLQAEACKIFPQLRGVEWEFEWGGLVAMTKNHMPHLIELGNNFYAGMGYNGRGVAMGTIMGKQLAELVMGEDVPMPREKLSPFAFHWFHKPGIAYHMITGRLMDRLT
jgi:glycine/D-amino acid oxidase-like deaminating enzyme